MAENLRRGRGRPSASPGPSKSPLGTTLCSDKGVKRCGRSCRPRWGHYVRPDPHAHHFSTQEEELIIRLHSAIGSRWSIIAEQLTGRTEGEVKNHWNSKLRKRLREMGIDHVTHKPFSQLLADYVTINAVPSSPESFSSPRQLTPGGSPAVPGFLSAAPANVSPVAGPTACSFSWQDFLLEEVFMAQEAAETAPPGEHGETVSGLGPTGTHQGDSFLEGILDPEVSMFMQLPLELLEDD